MSLSGHQSAAMRSDEWLTPPEWLAALGPFELDPCSPVARPWPTAARHYTREDDGLAQPLRADLGPVLPVYRASRNVADQR